MLELNPKAPIHYIYVSTVFYGLFFMQMIMMRKAMMVLPVTAAVMTWMMPSIMNKKWEASLIEVSKLTRQTEIEKTN